MQLNQDLCFVFWLLLFGVTLHGLWGIPDQGQNPGPWQCKQSPNLDQQGIPKSCVMDTSSSLCSRVSREGQEGSWTDRLEFGVKARGLKWRLTGMLMVVRITGPGHRGNETQKGGRGCLGWDSPPGKAWTAAQRPTREVTKETQGKPTRPGSAPTTLVTLGKLPFTSRPRLLL